ncbi:hypothetical protein Leryth_007900 [Lithospermum erythrorhizon]|nr:hypothetical protein Leryth_007900 [Lithospermum erythrorhizon]
MTSIITSHHCIRPRKIQDRLPKERSTGVPYFTSLGGSPSNDFFSRKCLSCSSGHNPLRVFSNLAGMSSAPMDPDDSEDETDKDKSSEKDNNEVGRDKLRDNLERLVGTDDSMFSGVDLATLIRNKFGRSYDVQLIKKEFMGRNLLAMNVMWKYMEQKSFPLSEEEYILRLDDVANSLRCWGAVSHIRNSLEKLREKERPRIGKAVSIFIDMDESGGRADEWIYK